MSVHVSSWLWRNSTAKGSELLLLLAIADWADDNGKAWPSVDTLSQKTRLSKRQTQSIVRQLEADKLLITHPNQGPNGVNIYQIIMGGEKIAPVQSGVEGGAVQRTEGVKPTAPNTSIDTSENTLSFSSSDEGTNDGAKTPSMVQKEYDQAVFDRFWSVYPRKVAKGDARKAFNKVIKTVPLHVLIDSVEKHKKSEQWKDPKFIPHPATWLNGERWEDDVTKPVAQGGGQVVRKADPEASQKAWDDIMRPYYEGTHEN